MEPILGVFGGLLGSSWEPFGRPLTPPGEPLGAPGASLGLPCELLGALWDGLGIPWASFGKPLGASGHVLEAFGHIFGISCRLFLWIQARPAAGIRASDVDPAAGLIQRAPKGVSCKVPRLWRHPGSHTKVTYKGLLGGCRTCRRTSLGGRPEG